MRLRHQGASLCGASQGAWTDAPSISSYTPSTPLHPAVRLLTGTAKLADFGLATRLSGAPLRSPLDLAATSSSLAFPAHSLGLGSRGFTPPERLRPLLCTPAGVGVKEAEAVAAEGEAVGAHDIFSLGVLSHLVLCGSRLEMASALGRPRWRQRPICTPGLREGPGRACSPARLLA